MDHNYFLKAYAEMFDYRQSINSNKAVLYFKPTSDGMLSMSSDLQSKYVKFRKGSKIKKFKKSDLFLAVLERTPVGWEEEKNVKL